MLLRSNPQDQLFYRTFEIDRAVDPETRSVDLSFSSETPVKRWFGSEILLHGDENVDLSWLRRMGSVLLNHNPSMIVGRAEKPRIEDLRGKATCVFDDDDDGRKAMNKVNSKSLRGVSVGYAINKFREIRQAEEWNGIKGPAYVATRWTPYEISLTPIPTDASVGVGRELTRSLEGIEIERSVSTTPKEDEAMTKEEFEKMLRECLPGAMKNLIPDLVAQFRAAIAEEQRPRIRVSTEELLELNGQASAISADAQVRVAQLVAEGKSVEQIRSELLKLAAARINPDATDRGDLPDGTGLGTGRSTRGKVPPVKDMPEADFVRMVTNPALMTLQ
jgi:phage head maturation protease